MLDKTRLQAGSGQPRILAAHGVLSAWLPVGDHSIRFHFTRLSRIRTSDSLRVRHFDPDAVSRSLKLSLPTYVLLASPYIEQPDQPTLD